MSVVRLIFVTVTQEDAAAAERIWKEECAPLMIRQEGCRSEELLRSTDTPGELISYSVWADRQSIDRYLASSAHAEIKGHTRRLKIASAPVVKHYALV